LLRHTADRLTSAEGTLSTERFNELQTRVEELTSRLSQERKESCLGLEKEKANTSELRTEVAKLKARLEDTIRAAKDERDRQKEELRKARTEKEVADRQFFELRERIRGYEAQVGELQRGVQEAEDGRRLAEADSQEKQKSIVELEEKLLEKNKRIQVGVSKFLLYQVGEYGI
jgi:chromosome segregation ATPase